MAVMLPVVVPVFARLPDGGEVEVGRFEFDLADFVEFVPVPADEGEEASR